MADDVRVYATSINAIIKDKEHAKHIYETAHIINILYINATVGLLCTIQHNGLNNAFYHTTISFS